MAALLCLALGGVSAKAETLNWSYPGVDTQILNASSATTINGVTVTTSSTSAGAFDSNSDTILWNSTSNAMALGILRMRMNATSDNGTASQTTRIDFSEPVYNFSFAVVDIDGGPTYTGAWNDIVNFASSSGAFPSGVAASGVSYNSATGQGIAISNVNAHVDNGNPGIGTLTVTFPGPVTWVTIQHIAADATANNPSEQVIYLDDLTFTRSPRLAVGKSSSGGSGSTTFNFNVSNSGTGVTATSVATSGTAVTGTQIRLNTTNVATTITETGPAGWILSPATAACADSNFAVSGNTATFSAVVSGMDVTVAAVNIRAGAVITCTINNAKRPTVQIRKTTTNSVGSFNFSGDNGYGTDAIATTVAGTPAPGAVRTLTLAGTATDITETVTAGYFISAAPTCTGMPSGGTFTLVSGSTYRLNAAALAANANVVCTFVNTLATPQLAVTKSTPTVSVNGAGQTISYSIAVSNPGNVAVANITVTDALGTVTCPGGNPIPSLAPAAQVNCTFSYAVLQADLNNNGGGDGDIDNTANAGGTYSGSPVSGNGATSVAIVRNPNVAVLKSWAFRVSPAGDLNSNGTADRNDVIIYTYRVINSGNLTLNGLSVADVHEGAALPAGLIINEQLAPGGSPLSTDATANNGVWSVLQPGDAVLFTYQHTVTQIEVDNG